MNTLHLVPKTSLRDMMNKNKVGERNREQQLHGNEWEFAEYIA